MQGKTCVITGATSGLGNATALALARLGANLILIGRNESAGTQVVRSARGFSPNAKIEFIPTDLSVQNEVRALAARIQQISPTIDVLINNAGARFDTYQESADGIEMTFALNHLSHFMLTNLLLDALRKAPEPRVVTVGSRAHAIANDEGGWFFKAHNFNRRLAYAKSKLANIVFAYELARRTGLSSNAVDPGVVATHFARNNGLKAWLKHLLAHGLKRELVTPAKGADTIIYLASSPEVRGMTSCYFHERRQIKSNPASYDLAAGERLWSLSLKLTSTPPLRSASPGR